MASVATYFASTSKIWPESSLPTSQTPNRRRLSATSKFSSKPSQAPLHSSYSSSFSSSSSSSSINDPDVTDKASTLRDICRGFVPDDILDRAEDVGFVLPTDVQRQALPIILSGRDCVLHAQTGSGKTLTYLLLIFSVIKAKRSVVQAIIVVPTRELGIQVAKVARMLAAKPKDLGPDGKSCTIMALLDGGMLRRHKSWLKGEPPEIVVATMGSLCQMLEKEILNLESMQVLVIDEVDFMFNSSKQVRSLKKLLTSYSKHSNRQTIFASASIPQHRHFLFDCMQQKWTKHDVVHIHVNPVEPMPSCIHHRFVTCSKIERHQTLLSILQSDVPGSGIIFVNQQSEKSKRAGNAASTTTLIDFLRSSYSGFSDILLLEEDMNFNLRAASLAEVRQGRGGYLVIATDIAARGVDLPETTHIYNFDLPKSAVDYLHRAGRTGRQPFSDKICRVTSIITSEERFVLRRFENELMFHCQEVPLYKTQSNLN